MPRIRIDKKSWDTGYKAGLAGKPEFTPPGVDGFSFWSAVIKGQAAREKREAARGKIKLVEQTPKAEP